VLQRERLSSFRFDVDIVQHVSCRLVTVVDDTDRRAGIQRLDSHVEARALKDLTCPSVCLILVYRNCPSVFSVSQDPLHRAVNKRR
jgi:hypothetical protein